MEMKVNSQLIIRERSDRAWSQQQLANIASVSLRTIQRVEKSGTASMETLQAISSAFDKIPSDLTAEPKFERKSRNSLFKTAAALIALISSSLFVFSYTTASTETVGLSIGYEISRISTQDESSGSLTYIVSLDEVHTIKIATDISLVVSPIQNQNGDVEVGLKLTGGHTQAIEPEIEAPMSFHHLDDGARVTYTREDEIDIEITVNRSET